MTKGRMEAFSDGMIAIFITVMVLEFKGPRGADWSSLRPLIPAVCTYALSYVFLGIYWNNHHHLLHAAGRINGKVLWANLHLLFWLSFVPVATAWMGEYPQAPLPCALYGVILGLAAVAYTILQSTLIAAQGETSRIKVAVGGDLKGKVSLAGYGLAVPLAYYAHPWVADGIYVGIALLWLVPDRRIEKSLGDPA